MKRLAATAVFTGLLALPIAVSAQMEDRRPTDTFQGFTVGPPAMIARGGAGIADNDPDNAYLNNPAALSSSPNPEARFTFIFNKISGFSEPGLDAPDDPGSMLIGYLNRTSTAKTAIGMVNVGLGFYIFSQNANTIASPIPLIEIEGQDGADIELWDTGNDRWHERKFADNSLETGALLSGRVGPVFLGFTLIGSRFERLIFEEQADGAWDRTASFSSSTFSVRFGAQVQITRSWNVGFSHRTGESTKGKELTPGDLSNDDETGQGLVDSGHANSTLGSGRITPPQTQVGMRYYSDRMYLLAADLGIVGATPDTYQFGSDFYDENGDGYIDEEDARRKGESGSLIIRAGGEIIAWGSDFVYRYNNEQESEVRLANGWSRPSMMDASGNPIPKHYLIFRGGTYLEQARVADADDRVHVTLGAELAYWIFTLGFAVDKAMTGDRFEYLGTVLGAEF